MKPWAGAEAGGSRSPTPQDRRCPAADRRRIARARATGTAPKALDPEQAVTALLALMDGLGVQALTGYYSPETALEVFDASVRQLLRGDAPGTD